MILGKKIIWFWGTCLLWFCLCGYADNGDNVTVTIANIDRIPFFAAFNSSTSFLVSMRTRLGRKSSLLYFRTHRSSVP